MGSIDEKTPGIENLVLLSLQAWHQVICKKAYKFEQRRNYSYKFLSDFYSYYHEKLNGTALGISLVKKMYTRQKNPKKLMKALEKLLFSPYFYSYYLQYLQL